MQQRAQPRDFLDLLHTDPWFDGQPQPLRDGMIGGAYMRSVSEGETLFHRSAAPDGLYAVVAGALRVSGMTPEGKEAVLSLLEPCMWFGEISLFDDFPRTHDIVAVKDAKLVHVPRDVLHAILAQRPEYWRELGKLMALKLRFSFITIEHMALLSSEQRLTRRLIFMAQRALQGTSANQVTLSLWQGQLALMLSLSRQTINALLRDLEEAGLVQMPYGKIEIQDLQGLIDRAGLSRHELQLLRTQMFVKA